MGAVGLEHVHCVFPGVIAGGLRICFADLSTPLPQKPGDRSRPTAACRSGGPAFRIIESRPRFIADARESDSLDSNYPGCNRRAAVFASFGDSAPASEMVSHTSHKSAHNPYFLYAVSNAGSLLALLAFPFVLEPIFAVRTQSIVWATVYAALVVLIIGCVILVNTRRAATNQDKIVVDNPAQIVGAAKRLEWTLLALVPSSLMLGVTTYIATDIVSVPLIWIIPLVLYLLTFILAFSRKQIIKPSIASTLLPVAIVCIGILKILNPPISIWVTFALHLLLFFLAAFVCQERLAQSRPAVSKLVEYFLWISIGGVLGGAFNALLAPLIFPTPLEYPIAIVLSCLMRPSTNEEKRAGKTFIIFFPCSSFS